MFSFIKKIMAMLFVSIAITSFAQAKVKITHADDTYEYVDLRQEGNTYYWIVENQRLYLRSSDKCEGEECPTSATDSATDADSFANFGVHGSNTIGAELMPALIDAYASAQSLMPKTTKGEVAEENTITASNDKGQKVFEVDLRAHGSGTSFPSLIDGNAEIGMASRHVKDKEAKALDKVGIKGIREAGKEHVLALDGLVVIVHPDNPVSTLTLTQIAQLFSGEITNWSQVGGNDQPVSVYSRDSKSGTYDTFKGLVLKTHGKKLTADAKLYESNEKLSDDVSYDKNAIGFTGFAYVRNSKALSLASSCGITYEPTVFSVKTEEYPLSRRLYLYTTGRDMSDQAKGLLDFSLSDEAQEVISDVDFINQSVEKLNFSHQGQRIARTVLPDNLPNLSAEMPYVQNMFELLMHGERLSTTFRFKTGSFDLDVKGVRDIQRIADLINNSDEIVKGKNIYLVGYADSIGSFDKNLHLSRERADRILKVLLEKVSSDAKERIYSVGFGELSPVSCNTDESGNRKNRRVEIWVK